MDMTDSQKLLAEYVRTGSEAAFRELVARYVDLVYSTALRLVEETRIGRRMSLKSFLWTWPAPRELFQAR